MNEHESVLRRSIEDALEVLAPKFKIDDLGNFPEPGVRVYDGRTLYDPNENSLQFNTRDINNCIAIGEEVSHYFHLEINKDFAYKQWLVGDVDSEVTALGETVGRYGGLVYSNERGQPVSKADCTVRWRRNPDVKFMDDLREYASYLIGYGRAWKLFEKYGETMLPTVSRMDVDESEKVLMRIAPVTYIEKKIIPIVDLITGYKPNLSPD